MKKKKQASSSMKNQIWNEEGELALLKGLVEYRCKDRSEPRIDWDAFLCFVGVTISAKISKKEMLSKLKKLKKNFAVNLERINGGKDPYFTRSTDSLAFGFAMTLWANNNNHDDDDDDVAGQVQNSLKRLGRNNDETLKEAEKITNKAIDWKDIDEDDTHPYELGNARDTTVNEEDEAATDEPLIEIEAEETSTDTTTTVKEIYEVRETHQEVANTEPLNENEPQEHPAFSVESNREEEEEDADVVEEELCELRDAFETTLAEGASNCCKKYMLEKINNMETRKRKDLSSEWKAIRSEGLRLRIKKFRFAAKLAEVTL
ncbi:unnamed protein product [Cochlearia groenlandica]